MTRYGIQIEQIDTASVDWHRVILDAVQREPPFERGEKEKGFRDAIILETFLQIVERSPSSRSSTRLVLVSGDQRLRQAAENRVSGRSNVHLVDSIEALKGLIATLASAVDEDFISKISRNAAELFFVLNDRNTLYYKASVGTSLSETLQNATVPLPAGADKYKVETWSIGSPRFVSKQGQRIYWMTRVEARLKALKSTLATWRDVASVLGSESIVGLGGVGSEHNLSGISVPSKFSIYQPSAGLVGLGSIYKPSEGVVGLGSIYQSEDQLVADGTGRLDVSWSLSVTTSGALTKPKLESVRFVEVVWG